jgi:hypothetical protein
VAQDHPDMEVGAVPQALFDEYRALAERVREDRLRADRLRAIVAHVEAQVERDEVILAEFEAALGIADQLRVDDLDPRLRGQRLERIAVGLLRDQRNCGDAIHYREWFGLVRVAGYEVAGKDPLATFLTQMRRSQAVEPVGRRSGLYRLRAA